MPKFESFRLNGVAVIANTYIHSNIQIQNKIKNQKYKNSPLTGLLDTQLLLSIIRTSAEKTFRFKTFRHTYTHAHTADRTWVIPKKKFIGD